MIHATKRGGFAVFRAVLARVLARFVRIIFFVAVSKVPQPLDFVQRVVLLSFNSLAVRAAVF